LSVGRGKIAANEKSRTMHPAKNCKIDKKDLSRGFKMAILV